MVTTIEVIPHPYPDELHYSLWARVGARWRFPSRGMLSALAFGNRAVSASVELPSHLGRELISLPVGHLLTLDQLIDNHTLLPFYAPFLPAERVRQLRADMRGNHGAGVYARAGLKASQTPSLPGLRYCRRCADDDRQRVGETYWRRVHQVVGVERCPRHDLALSIAQARVPRQHTAYEFTAAEDVVPHGTELTIAAEDSTHGSSAILRHPIFAAITADVEWLLAQHDLTPGLGALRLRYHALLTERDLTVRGGRIRMRDVEEQFMRRIPLEVQQHVHCALGEDRPDHWLARLLRAPRVAQHPIHHLLALYMLNITADDFFAPLLPVPSHPSARATFMSAEKVTPFGAPPWPCLNPASEHYGELRIWRHDMAPLRYIRGVTIPPPRARFTCDCGFIYIRTGPDRNVDDRFRCDHVERYGDAWEQQLAELWRDSTLSLRAVAHRLGVDPLTVKRHAAQSSLPAQGDAYTSLPAQSTHRGTTPRHLRLRQSRDQGNAEVEGAYPDTTGVHITADRPVHEAQKTPLSSARQLECRALWSAAVASGASEGTKRLRQHLPAVYMWLYRHDQAWLSAHTPPRRQAKGRSSRRVNWTTRDQGLAQAVVAAAQRLLARDGAPVRLSRSALARETGHSDVIFQRIRNLPQTKAALAQASESREAFAIRRIHRAATQFVLEGTVPARWRLVRRAGVDRFAKLDAVAQEVTTTLSTIAQVSSMAVNKACDWRMSRAVVCLDHFGKKKRFYGLD